jgi:hypothetical protein
VTLLTRVKRLESRIKIPVKPVYVVFQQEGESYKEVVSRTKAENYYHEAMLIMVNFVEP